MVPLYWPRYLRPKLHRIFLDSRLNDCWQVCAVNIYENAILTAAKSHAYIRSVERSNLARFSDVVLLRILSIYYLSLRLYFLGMVREVEKYLERRVRQWCFHPMIVGLNLPSKLFVNALIAVWKQKPTRYSSILKVLEDQTVYRIEDPELIFKLDAVGESLLTGIIL